MPETPCCGNCSYAKWPAASTRPDRPTGGRCGAVPIITKPQMFAGELKSLPIYADDGKACTFWQACVQPMHAPVERYTPDAPRGAKATEQEMEEWEKLVLSLIEQAGKRGISKRQLLFKTDIPWHTMRLILYRLRGMTNSVKEHPKRIFISGWSVLAFDTPSARFALYSIGNERDVEYSKADLVYEPELPAKEKPFVAKRDIAASWIK